MKKFSVRKALAAFALIITLIIPQMGCGSNGQNNNAGISKTGFYLDTICKVTIFSLADEDGTLAAMDDEQLETECFKIITDAFKVCSELEKLLSKTVEGSDIDRINKAGGKAVEVDNKTVEVLKKGLKYGEISGGAFDITIGKASDLWDFHDDLETGHEGGEIPSGDALAEAVKHVDYTKVEIEGNKVRLADPEAEINLGGIAKGYIADQVAAYLEERGVTGAVVDLGGNIVVIGRKAAEFICANPAAAEETVDFRIGITDPTSGAGQILGVMPCSNTTVVTSGTYERYFEQDGIKYHHILDVETGYPAETDVLSVTIISARGNSAECDGLSTTCLALGVEKGLELVRSMEGFDGVFVDVSGNVEMSNPDMEFEFY